MSVAKVQTASRTTTSVEGKIFIEKGSASEIKEALRITAREERAARKAIRAVTDSPSATGNRPPARKRH